MLMLYEEDFICTALVNLLWLKTHSERDGTENVRLFSSIDQQTFPD